MKQIVMKQLLLVALMAAIAAPTVQASNFWNGIKNHWPKLVATTVLLGGACLIKGAIDLKDEVDKQDKQNRQSDKNRVGNQSQDDVANAKLSGHSNVCQKFTEAETYMATLGLFSLSCGIHGYYKGHSPSNILFWAGMSGLSGLALAIVKRNKPDYEVFGYSSWWPFNSW